VRRKSVLVIGLLLACVTRAPAQGSCAEPVVPPPVDGAMVHENELRAALARARDYIAQAGVYQDCLAREVEALKAQAATDGAPFEPMIETSAREKVAASKRSQEKVGAAVNRALTAYKQAHAK
jgi:hypothetical protein